MSMNNSSTINEQLIAQIIHNVDNAPVSKRISRLYNTIINQSVLHPVTEYDERVTLVDEDAIIHHGCTTKTVTKKYPNARKNLATAIRILRQKLPMKQAKWLVSDKDNLKSDSLYHAINDFKYRCNSDYYALFSFDK